MRIVSHEAGDMDRAAWRFISEQVIYDIERMGCDHLTQWRWAIGSYSLNRAKPEVIAEVWETILGYPKMRYTRCRFTGMPRDVPVWRAAGYKVSVDYRHSVGKLTVIGANCH